MAFDNCSAEDGIFYLAGSYSSLWIKS